MLKLAFLALVITTSAMAQTPFTTTYKALDFDTSLVDGHDLAIKGLLPAAASNKCYIFTLGTGNPMDSTYPTEFMKDMVSNGFCAATVEYSHSSLASYGGLWVVSNGLSVLERKAKNIYDISWEHSKNSAIRRIEAASNGICKCDHVVAHGFSQGAHIAALSKNFNQNVAGVLMFSGGCQAGLFDSCHLLTKAKTKIPKNKIRDISAQNDGVLGCGSGVARKALHQVKITTGANCDGHTSCSSGANFDQCESCCAVGSQCNDQCTCDSFVNNCLAADGSGYYILKNSQYPFTGTDGHGWFGTSNPALWNQAMTTSEPFNILTNLAWLRGTVDSVQLVQTEPEAPAEASAEQTNDKWTE